MFGKNNKNSNKEKDLDSVNLKHWDKEEYIKTKLNNRTLSFYIFAYRKNLNLAFILIILSFVVSIMSFFVVMKKNSTDLFFLNTISGKIIEYKLDKEKVDQLNKTFKKINEQKNNK